MHSERGAVLMPCARARLINLQLLCRNLNLRSFRSAELFRLLSDCQSQDILLIEDVDRLSRLREADWQNLKAILRDRQIKIVAVNVPTTWQSLKADRPDLMPECLAQSMTCF